ncbi:hypothetical protein AGOR_G00132420 [Albula goreensis]|uniref:Uncharacterized protein n=1 Tax=Albula goreensis TaxID=1534307 RepID=A0A8T3D7T7_9TELE|nr:hypothetical protein AGOR_G00132420 [Albula goreensis]
MRLLNDDGSFLGSEVKECLQGLAFKAPCLVDDAPVCCLSIDVRLGKVDLPTSFCIILALLGGLMEGVVDHSMEASAKPRHLATEAVRLLVRGFPQLVKLLTPVSKHGGFSLACVTGLVAETQHSLLPPRKVLLAG